VDRVDFIVIGAGVIGLSVAAELTKRNPEKSVVVLDKEQQFGWHTSSRNSEVIHGGMYYPTGSLKAKLCIAGRPLLYDFCEKHKIPHQRIGKLIIAREEAELHHIEDIAKQGKINGMTDLKLLDKSDVMKLEPHITAVAAIHSPSTGIIDSHKLMAKFEQIVESGPENFIAYKNEVINVKLVAGEYQVAFRGPDGAKETLACGRLINCAGLWSDQVCSWLGMDVEKTGCKIYWVKGEYFSISASKSKLLNHLIYPPPLKALKGLGIHVTKSLDGRARLGPSAFYIDDVNYDVDPAHGDEFFVAAQSYLPFVTRDDISPDMAGVRPKLQSPIDPVKDFVIRHEAEKGYPGFINLVGIESPGLTASIAIGRMAADLSEE
jgi:L-2-hydroxyglutarate oxidase LhgO